MKCNREFWKIYNSFSIVGVDITPHANSRTHAKRTFFRTERPLHAKLYKNVEKKNSNMAYNDSWSTWEQKGRAEPRREKNTRRVKTTACTTARGRCLLRPPANKFAIAFDSKCWQSPRLPYSRRVDDSYCAQPHPLSCYTPLKIRWLRWENSLRILLYVSGRIAPHSSLKCE